MTRDPRRITDEVRTVVEGMDSGNDPEIIDKNRLSMLINGTVRKGFAMTRPGFRKIELEYGGNETLQNGLFQGASYFQDRSGKGCLIASISGLIFRYDLQTPINTVTNVTPKITIGGNIFLDQNSAQIREAWFCQAEDWIIIQNGAQRPIFIDAVTSRRAQPGELPVGCMMEYSKGRVGIVRPERESIAFGDIVYGPSGTAPYNRRDGVLKYTENTFLNEGGEFAVPGSFGKINAIRSIAVLNAIYGQGPVQVGTSKAMFSLNLPVDRTIWKNLTFPAETASFIGAGPLSQDGCLNAQGDLWFRAKDGIRALVIAERRFGEPGNTPLSGEVSRVLDEDQQRLLNYESAILFDNRMIRTCVPAMSFLHGTYHRGLSVIDFDVLSAMSGKLPPAYDGIWTGLRILKLVMGEFDKTDRAFAFVLSEEDKIELWEITKDETYDNLSTPIEMVAETAALFDGEQVRKLSGGDMAADDIKGTVEFDVKWKPDQYPGWFDWHSWSECQEDSTCLLEDCAPVRNLNRGYRPRMRFPEDPTGPRIVDSNLPAHLAYLFQLRLAFTGHVRLKRVHLHTQIQDEQPQGECRGTEPCLATDLCVPGLFGYSSEA